MKCNFCGLDVQDSDTHGTVSVLANGDISIKCRLAPATTGPNAWEGRYNCVVPMPGQRLYFSKIQDPDAWPEEWT